MAANEQIVLPSLNPMELLRIAVSQNFDTEKLKQLMDLQDRWERNEARKAFVSAMTEFKRNPPEIIRTRKGEHNTYAGLDRICKAVMSALSAQGISHRWEYEQSRPDWINVSCILTHEGGHSERTTMGGPPDLEGPKGNATKNAIQALASTRTYLERYTLLGAVGLESAYDDDGVGAKGIPEDKQVERLDWIRNAENVSDLKKAFQVAYQEANDAGDKVTLKTYIDAKNKRYKELSLANAAH